MSVDIRSVTLERRVLGSLIKIPEIFLNNPICDYLDPADFSNGHAVMFSVIKNQIITNQPVDTAILTEKIRSLGISLNGKTEKDIYVYLTDISTPPTSEIIAIEAIKELKTVTLRREIYECVDNIGKKMHESGGLTPDQIVGLADGLYNERINSYQITGQPEDLFSTIITDLEDLAANPVDEVGLSTPYEKFNLAIGGLIPGNVYSVVSRSGDGKSTWLNDLTIKMSKEHDADCLILDTEMDKLRTSLRAAANITGIPYWFLRSGNWAKNPAFFEIWKQKKSELEEYKNRVSHLYVANRPIEELESIIRRWRIGKVGRSKKKVITTLDYLKLAGESDRNKQEYQLIGQKCSKYKDISVDLEMISLTAGQANRSGAGQNPVDDDSVVASSDRFIWFFDWVGLFRLKTHVEIASDSLEFGTHKLINLKTRDQGREAAGHQDLVKVTRKDQRGKDKIGYEPNFINFKVDNFAVTERGTLKDIVESQTNGPVNLSKNPEDDQIF